MPSFEACQSLALILQAELEYDALLPKQRLQGRPTQQLLAAAERWSNEVWNKAMMEGATEPSDKQKSQALLLMASPVFICGAHRSGTTLVRDLLDGHAELAVLPSEGTFYTNLEQKFSKLPEQQQAAFYGKEWLRRLANPINQPPYWLLGRSTDNNSPYVCFVRYLLYWWTVVPHVVGTQWPHTALILAYASSTDQLSAKSWVDKTPMNERFLLRIWQEMPTAKVIQVIRNPASILASRKMTDPFFNMRSVIADIRFSFKKAMMQIKKQDPRFMIIRYEMLCDEPAVYLPQLAAFLAIPMADTLQYPTVAGYPAMSNSSFNKVPTLGQIIKSDQPGEILSADEKELLAAALAKLSSRLGYPLKRIGWVKRIYLLIKHRIL